VLLAGQTCEGYDLSTYPVREHPCVLVIPPNDVRVSQRTGKEEPLANFLLHLWSDDGGQDIAEYAVMLAVILVIVVGTIRLIGSNANNVFSQVGSSIQ